MPQRGFAEGYPLGQQPIWRRIWVKVLAAMLARPTSLCPLFFLLRLDHAEAMPQLARPPEFLQARIDQAVLKVDCTLIDLVADAGSAEGLSVKDVQHCSPIQITVPVVIIVGKISLNEILEFAKFLDHDPCRHLTPTLHIDADAQHRFGF